MENNNFLTKVKNFFLTKGQSIALLCFFGLVLIGFIYVLAFMTPFVGTVGNGIQYSSNKSSGKEIFYYGAQEFNTFIFKVLIALVIVGALTLLLGNRIRKKFYITNFVVGYGFSILSIVLSIISISKLANVVYSLKGAVISPFKDSTGNILVNETGASIKQIGGVFNVGLTDRRDAFSALTINTLYNDGRYTVSGANVMFNLGYALFILLIVFAVINICIVTYKLLKQYVFNKKKEEIVNHDNVEEAA